MNSNYIDILNDLFSDSSSISKDKALGLMDETMVFFRQMKTKLESDDPAQQKQAFEETMEMKRILESKMQALAEKTGLDMTQLAALAENTNGMFSEEQGIVEEVGARLHQIQTEEKETNKQKIKG